MDKITVLILIAIFLICVAMLCTACVYLATSLKNETDLKRQMFLFSLPVNDEENFLILDRLIKEELQRYQIYNFPKYADDLYINKEEQDKMCRIILRDVLIKLSPVYLNKLKYIYNENILEDIIYEKVCDAVLNLTVEINGQFNDTKEKNK